MPVCGPNHKPKLMYVSHLSELRCVPHACGRAELAPALVSMSLMSEACELPRRRGGLAVADVPHGVELGDIL